MKIFSRIAIALVAFGLALPAMAQDNVSITLHNLSDSGAAGSSVLAGQQDQICVFCHTPHQANATVGVALWNKGDTGSVYVMYPTGGTMDMIAQVAPQGVSLACLSCHDGTQATDNMINAPGTGGVTAGTDQGYTFKGGAGFELIAGAALVGVDLGNDHPISITYDNSATGDTAFNAAASVITAGLPLYGVGSDQVECGSCHNPHDNQFGTFLRMDNAASVMCLTCHIK